MYSYKTHDDNGGSGALNKYFNSPISQQTQSAIPRCMIQKTNGKCTRA